MKVSAANDQWDTQRTITCLPQNTQTLGTGQLLRGGGEGGYKMGGGAREV